MTEFEIILLLILIPLYCITFHIAGRMDVFEHLLTISEEEVRKNNDKQND